MGCNGGWAQAVFHHLLFRACRASSNKFADNAQAFINNSIDTSWLDGLIKEKSVTLRYNINDVTWWCSEGFFMLFHAFSVG